MPAGWWLGSSIAGESARAARSLASSCCRSVVRHTSHTQLAALVVMLPPPPSPRWHTHSPTRDTKIGTQLEAKVLTPLVYNRRLAKPLLVVTVTDGEPSESPQDKVAKVIRSAPCQVLQQPGSSLAQSWSPPSPAHPHCHLQLCRTVTGSA